MANDPAAKPGANSNPAAKLGSGKRIARKQPAAKPGASSKARSQQREPDHRQATNSKTRERSTSPGDSSGNAQPPNRPRQGPS